MKSCHTSTSETYGTAQFVPITEDHPLVGQSPYAVARSALIKSLSFGGFSNSISVISHLIHMGQDKVQGLLYQP